MKNADINYSYINTYAFILNYFCNYYWIINGVIVRFYLRTERFRRN